MCILLPALVIGWSVSYFVLSSEPVSLPRHCRQNRFAPSFVSAFASISVSVFVSDFRVWICVSLRVGIG